MAILVVITVSILLVIGFVLAVVAAARQGTGKVIIDSYDQITFCFYDYDFSTSLGFAAFSLVLISQALMTITTCFCRGRSLIGSKSKRCCVIFLILLSWISFIIAVACLLGASIKEAHYTKLLGYYAKTNLLTCGLVRKCLFAGGAVMVMLCLFFSVLLFRVTRIDPINYVSTDGVEFS